jgi:hypothetical protein
VYSIAADAVVIAGKESASIRVNADMQKTGNREHDEPVPQDGTI